MRQEDQLYGQLIEKVHNFHASIPHQIGWFLFNRFVRREFYYQANVDVAALFSEFHSHFVLHLWFPFNEQSTNITNNG